MRGPRQEGKAANAKEPIVLDASALGSFCADSGMVCVDTLKNILEQKAAFLQKCKKHILKKEKIMGNYKRLIEPIKEMYKTKRLVADWHEKEHTSCQLLDEIRSKYNEEAAEYCENAFPEETEDYTGVFLVTVVDGGHPYSVLVHEKDKEKALAVIKDAIKEYDQDNAYFHDEITGLLPDDLCRIFFSEAEFPVIKYFMPEPSKCVSQERPSPMEGKGNMEYRDTAPLFGASFLD